MTPYQRIMRVARRGKGLRLSADEVRALSQDNAVERKCSVKKYLMIMFGLFVFLACGAPMCTGGAPNHIGIRATSGGTQRWFCERLAQPFVDAEVYVFGHQRIGLQPPTIAITDHWRVLSTQVLVPVMSQEGDPGSSAVTVFGILGGKWVSNGIDRGSSICVLMQADGYFQVNVPEAIVDNALLTPPGKPWVTFQQVLCLGSDPSGSNRDCTWWTQARMTGVYCSDPGARHDYPSDGNQTGAPDDPIIDCNRKYVPRVGWRVNGTTSYVVDENDVMVEIDEMLSR